MFKIILYHYDIHNIKQLFSICQYTNVISYYILKYIFIEDIDEAIICLFNKIKIKKYILNKIINFINNNEYFNNILNYNYNLSIRMTILEIN